MLMLADTDTSTDAEFFRIVDELTRRGFLGGIAGAAGLLGLAACGPSGAADTTSSSSATTTRTVDTATGRVTVPANPARVVCIDYFTAIFLLELGLTPVGGIDYSWIDDSTMYPAYVAPLKKLAGIGQITATNIEKVAALHPDLILGPTPGSRYDNSKGAIGRLSSLAPVATVDFGTSGDWRGPFRQTANIVNRTARLAPLIDAYQQAVAAAKAKYASTLASTVVSVLDYAQQGNFALDLPKSGDGVILADLGVRFGSASGDNGSNSRELSFERLGELADSDVILYRADAGGKPANGLAGVFALESWEKLPAVRAGHAYPIGWCDLCTYRWAVAAISDFTGILDRYRKDAP